MIDWTSDEWFAKHHSENLNDDFKTWWLIHYGEPPADDLDEYWCRCAFALMGWNAARIIHGQSMHINNQFKLGDVVSLICSADDSKGMIVCIHAQISGTVTYSVAWGDRAETVHFHSELKLIAVSDNDFVREQ